ncbi:uncharacterized protein LOC144477436, partial [Augochlora pura]
MDVFRECYSTYCFVLCLTGLWPDDESFLTKIQRAAISLLNISCIVVQATTLKTVELTLYNILIMLSYCFPMILYFLRYTWFVMYISEIRDVFESIGRDYSTMKDPVELGLFMKHMTETRRVIMAYIVLAVLLAVYIIIAILVPTVFHSNLQLRYLRMFGFFYNEENAQTDWVGLQLVLVSVLGQLALVGTEASGAVFSAYLCGLFEITSHRVHAAVKDVTKSISSKHIDIQPAIQIHQRAVELAANLGKCMTYSYLMAIVAVILSFAVNLYRVSIAG